MNPSQGNPYLNCRWDFSKSIISFSWYLFLLILWTDINHKQGKKRGRLFFLLVMQVGNIALSCSLIHTSPLTQKIPNENWVYSVLTNWAMKRRNNIIISSLKVSYSSNLEKCSIKLEISKGVLLLFSGLKCKENASFHSYTDCSVLIIAIHDSYLPWNGTTVGKHPSVISNACLSMC